MTRSFQVAWWSTVACLGGLLLAGCGANDTTADTYPVKGKVNYDGAPLSSAQIVFEDVGRGVTNVIPIENGEYSGEAAAGDLEAKVEKIEKVKDPMGIGEIDQLTPLKSGISVTISKGSNTLPTIDIDPGAP